MALNELRQRIPGYITLGLLITLTTFWTYWGVGEAYFEGWWGAWYNPLLYLVPAAVLLALTVVGIRWPQKGGWAIVVVGGGIFRRVVGNLGAYRCESLKSVLAGRFGGIGLSVPIEVRWR